MAKRLDQDDSVALLEHYQVDVASGHAREGTAIVISGAASSGEEFAITATIGDRSALRVCPVTEFLAEGLVRELGNSHLNGRPQLSRGIAGLIVRLSRMQLESTLASFSLTATIEGDHYEVLPKTVVIDASDKTKIPHRLTPHAHDR